MLPFISPFVLSQVSLAHRVPLQRPLTRTFRQDSLVQNSSANTSAPMAVCKIDAPSTVIQDGGQGPCAETLLQALRSGATGSTAEPVL